MADEKTNRIIEELLEELNQKYPDFRGIYLFGYRARDDFGNDSDYDMAVIFDNEINRQLKIEISRIMSRKMTEYDIIIDNPVLSYKNILNPYMPLIDNIIKDGIFYEWRK